MKISVIIINYNTFQLTCNCIQSIIEKTVGIDYEIILVDNASSDCSPEKFKEQFPFISLIKSIENIGFAKGNNIGIKQAKGEYILLLNSDTIVQTDTIKITNNILINNPNIGALTCQLKYPNGEIQYNCQSFPSKYKALIEKLRLHKLLSKKKRSKYFQGFYWDYNNSGFPDWIWGTFFMFKKDILNKLPNGKLNDDYFMYLEDMQWCWDIRNAGFQICYSPSTFVTHLCGSSGGNKEKWISESLKIFNRNTK